MIAIGGTLLLTPGFVTDIFGVLLLLPPTRAIARRLMRGYAARRFVVVGVGGSRGGPATPHDSAGRPYDFDGTAEEIDEDDPQLPR
jgi:UPF0716 protein FxsA